MGPWLPYDVDSDTELFPSILSSERAFSCIVDSLGRRNLSGGKPLDSQISIVLLGDQHAKNCSSGKSLKTKYLPLWRNIHMHRCALRGSLAPPP